MLLWTDAFELATMTAVTARYDSVTQSIDNPSSSGGRTNLYLPLGNGAIQKNLTPAKTMLVGVAHKVSTFVACDFIKLADGNGNLQLTLYQNGGGATGQFSLYRGDSTTGTLLATSSSITAGFWIYIELKATIGDTDGGYELRINDTAQFSASNVDTQNSPYANIGQITLNSRSIGNGTASINVDDYYIANVDAPMPIGLFFGAGTKVEMLLAEDFGAVTGYTPIGNASNWQNVDERAHNSDTDYNYSATLNASDLFTMQNLSAATGSIRGLQATYVARKEDALTRWTRPLIRSGGVVYPGGNDSLTTSYVHYFETWGFNPNTSTYFTIADINAIQGGYQNASVA